MSDTAKQGLFVFAALIVVFGGSCIARRNAVRSPPSSVPAASVPAALDEEDIEFDHATSSIVATLRLGKNEAATVRRAGEAYAGRDGMQLAYGDEVEAVKGDVMLSYSDMGVTVLGSGTKLVVSVPSADDGQENSFFVRLEVEAGNIWTRLERLLGPSESFQVSGNNVVATVRGTAFAFNVTGEDVDVSVADHAVEVTDEDDPTLVVRMKPGEAFRAKLADLRAQRGASPEAIRRRFVRALTVAERERPLFRRMLERVRSDFMQRPDNPLFLPVRPRLNRRLLERLTPEQRQRFLRRLRVSFERAHLMEQRIVPNPLLPLPFQLLRTVTTTR